MIVAFLAAFASYLAPDGTRVELYKEQALCMGEALVAMHVDGEAKTPGCWVQRGPVIWIVWFDTDSSALPASLFVKMAPS